MCSKVHLLNLNLNFAMKTVLFLIFFATALRPMHAQACDRITYEALSGDGLIATKLASFESAEIPQLSVQLIRYNFVCEATAGSRNRYRYVSLVAEYIINGETPAIISQFEFGCSAGVWGPEVELSIANTLTSPSDATLNTSLRTDCSLCLSPLRPGNTHSNDEHCSGGPIMGTIIIILYEKSCLHSLTHTQFPYRTLYHGGVKLWAQLIETAGNYNTV